MSTCEFCGRKRCAKRQLCKAAHEAGEAAVEAFRVRAEAVGQHPSMAGCLRPADVTPEVREAAKRAAEAWRALGGAGRGAGGPHVGVPRRPALRAVDPRLELPAFRSLSAQEHARDSDRVERAVWELRATRGEVRGTWYVDGGSEPHWVDLRRDSDQPCDCPDHANRNRLCAHIICAMLEAGRSVKYVKGLLDAMTARRLDRLWEQHLRENPQDAQPLRK